MLEKEMVLKAVDIGGASIPYLYYDGNGPTIVFLHATGFLPWLWHPIARELKSSFVLVHHTSKGLQSTKSVTDVGAGAGSQSRATDTHIILRPHQEDNVIVLEGESRSNPPIKPICLRWDFPVWRQELGLDPEDLEGIKPARKEVVKKAETMSVEEFVGQYFSQQPRTRDEIVSGISEEISNRRIQQLFSVAEGKGLVHRWNFGANKKVQYATVQQPPEE